MAADSEWETGGHTLGTTVLFHHSTDGSRHTERSPETAAAAGSPVVNSAVSVNSSTQYNET